MKSVKILVLLAFLTAIAITLRGASASTILLDDDNEEDVPNWAENESQEYLRTVSMRGGSRLLAQKMTCDNYPRVCRVSGSPGPDCCKKKCVNVSKDLLNCGKCGNKCKYWETCCKGKCVNPMSDKNHCGGCNNQCKKPSACVYGMCNYA